MTVAVTGASGLLGHAVVSALLARDEVRGGSPPPRAGCPRAGRGVVRLIPRHFAF
jgi:uncharacterized protein YbjT (DUF2867 family)